MYQGNFFINSGWKRWPNDTGSVMFSFKPDFESAVAPECSENSHSVSLCNLATRSARQKILMYHLYNIHYQILWWVTISFVSEQYQNSLCFYTYFSMPHLAFCDAIAAYIFGWGDINIFIFSVLFIVLLHMQLCVVFFFLCLNCSCHAGVFPELSNSDNLLGRYPAGQIELRLVQLGQFLTWIWNPKQLLLKVKYLAVSALASDSAEADKYTPKWKYCSSQFLKPGDADLGEGEGEEDHRSGWRKLTLERSKRVWQKQNIWFFPNSQFCSSNLRRLLCFNNQCYGYVVVWTGPPYLFWGRFFVSLLQMWEAGELLYSDTAQCVMMANWPKISMLLLFHPCHRD